ncbi:MAG: hypothetical protein NT033_04310, partial [Candidatus Omnitrophica bacterium]|nr:hypothetical protein [Candidatus Omnitrophota bacterium]
ARQANIKSVLPATGEDKTITSTISHPIPLENMPFYEKTMKWYMGEKANAALTDPVRHTLLVAEYGPEKANMAWSLLRSIRNIETGQTGAMTPAGIAETLDMMEKTRRIMIKVMDDEQDNIFGGGPGRNVRTHLRMLIQKLPCYKDAAAALGISFTGDPADSEIKLIAANVLSLYSFDFGDMYFTMFGPYQEGQYVTTGAVDEALDAFLDFYNANPIQIGDLSLPKTPQTNFTKEADLDNRSAALESLGRDPAREMREAATVQSFRANFRALESELRKRGANFDFIDESAIAWVSNAHTRNKIDLIGKCLRLYHRYYNTKDGTQKGMVVEFYPGKTLLAWEDDSAIVRHTGSDWMHSHTIKGPPPIHYFAISGDLELFAVMAPKFIREYRA